MARKKQPKKRPAGQQVDEEIALDGRRADALWKAWIRAVRRVNATGLECYVVALYTASLLAIRAGLTQSEFAQSATSLYRGAKFDLEVEVDADT